MLQVASLKKKMMDVSNILETFSCGKNRSSVKITKDLEVYINEKRLDIDFSSLEEAKKYTKEHISTQEILESIDITIPENRVASYIKKHYNIEKITDTLIESYIELASSNIFTVDPVIHEMKTGSSLITGKLDYTLEDGIVVAISESTQLQLNMLLKDRPEIVEYMRESKDNFMRIVREIKG
jgi:hypothetical protein